MSLSVVASHSADKGSSHFEQSCDDSNDLFDQFVTFDPIGHDISECHGLPASTLLAGPTTSRILPFHHNSTSGSRLYAELPGRAAISDNELVSFQNIHLGSPISPLSSPTFRAHSLPSSLTSPIRIPATIAQRRARPVEPIPKGFKKAHSFDKTLRSPIRKIGHSPKMMRDPEAFQNRMDVWKFPYGFERSDAPSTPPNASRISDASDTSSSVGVVKDTVDNIFGGSSSSDLSQPFSDKTEYDTPLATPVLDGLHSRRTSIQQPFSDGTWLPPTPQFHRSSGSWSKMHNLSEMDGFGTPIIHTPEIDMPVWLSHTATASITQPSPTSHVNARRATKSLAYQLQNDSSYDFQELHSSSRALSGLMIQMPGATVQQSYITPSSHMPSPHIRQQGHFGQTQAHAHRHQHPPPSRPYMPGETLRHSSSMGKLPSSTRYQSESPSPKSSPSKFYIRKRRGKENKEKKTPSSSPVDFVNFTPSDRRKILTGVAPSGSSKTRARREKEAEEKRRKLSIAALKAIREAGGDVDSLLEQGLFT